MLYSFSLLCSFWVSFSFQRSTSPLPHVGRTVPSLKSSPKWHTLGSSPVIKKSPPLCPLCLCWIWQFPSDSGIFYTDATVSSSRLCPTMSSSSVYLFQERSVSGSLLSGHVRQWWKRGSPCTEPCNQRVKCFRHATCSSRWVLTTVPQTDGPTVFPDSMNGGGHSTDMIHGASGMICLLPLNHPVSPGSCWLGFPDVSKIHLLPFSLAHSLYQPAIICHCWTLPGTWLRSHI